MIVAMFYVMYHLIIVIQHPDKANMIIIITLISQISKQAQRSDVIGLILQS